VAKDPIFILGAGIGGLSAAIHLACAGERVVVLEKNASVGGKMAQVHADGFRWDTGPSVITMRHVFEELFAKAGKNFADYVTLLPADPLTRYFYTDGTVLDISPRLAETLAQIQALSERDVEGYLAFLAYAATLHRITGRVFIYDEPPSLASFLKVNPLDGLKVDGLRTMHGAISAYVTSPHLRQLLGRFATYVGASPYAAPATLNVIAHVELAGGVWYPQGGIYKIAEAFEKLARELGVEICTEAPVAQIEVAGGRVTGVRLQNGEFLRGRAVVANTDVTSVYENLLPPSAVDRPKLRRLQSLTPSCSGFILLLGVAGASPRLAHHNIFFSPDYRREFDDIFVREIPPQAPTVYVAITAKADPQDAPPDHENWFVLVNAPALSHAYDWKAQKTAYRETVLQTLADFGHNLTGRIVSEQMFTPHEIEAQSGARGGALYGVSSNERFAAFLRPHNRDRKIRGLYFAGGTTHPGGGVPMVTLSGGVAAKFCLQDLEAG